MKVIQHVFEFTPRSLMDTLSGNFGKRVFRFVKNIGYDLRPGKLDEGFSVEFTWIDMDAPDIKTLRIVIYRG